MKRLHIHLLAATLLISGSAGLTSCKNDDPEIEVLQPLAGGYLGTETCDGTTSDEYETVIFNTADNNKSEAFVSNIGDINHFWTPAGGEDPHQQLVVSLQDGKFTLPPTTRTFRIYENTAGVTAGSTATAAAGRPIDLRSTFTYTITATGTISGKVLTMDYEYSNSSRVRRTYNPMSGLVVESAPALGVLDYVCKFTGDKDARHH